MGALGAWRQNQSLLLGYIVILLVLAMVVFVSGGFCLVLTDQAIASVRSQWNVLKAQGLVTGSLAAAESQISSMMTIIGVVCLILVPVFWYVIKQVVKMVTTLRAFGILLQMVTLLMLPLGMMISAGGVYVMENAAFSSAPITALVGPQLSFFPTILFGLLVPPL
jgi:hypothetical protein